MINQAIAHYLKLSLQPMEAITRLAGLVKTLETDRFSAEGKTQRFPIPVDAPLEQFTSAGRTYPDLVPDESERLIVYFEDRGTTMPNPKKWRSVLRLVAWGNGKLFLVGNQTHSSEIGLRLAYVMKKLLEQATPPAGALAGSMTVVVHASPESNANLFSSYTYSELFSQYLFPPYFAFALDLTITYTVNDHCTDVLTGLPVPGCC